MPALTDDLEALLAQHRRIGSPLPDYLRPGLATDTARKNIVAAIGSEVPDDLLELFGWHDGIDDAAWQRDGACLGFARLFGDTHFAPLADAIVEYRERIETDEQVARYSMVGAAQPTWKPSWFPAFCRGWDTYAVECRQARADVGRVYDPAWEPPSGAGPPRFRNLEHLVASAIRRFEAGGYTWNPATRFLDERTEVLRPLYEREIAEARA